MLVVDDDDNLLFNLGAYLESQGFRTVCVQRFADAVKVVVEHGVDVALVDYRIGRESGVELILELRRRRPHFPVVLMSAFLDEWVDCLLGGSTGARSLRKPFAGSEIVEALHAAVRGRHAVMTGG